MKRSFIKGLICSLMVVSLFSLTSCGKEEEVTTGNNSRDVVQDVEESSNLSVLDNFKDSLPEVKNVLDNMGIAYEILEMPLPDSEEVYDTLDYYSNEVDNGISSLNYALNVTPTGAVDSYRLSVMYKVDRESIKENGFKFNSTGLYVLSDNLIGGVDYANVDLRVNELYSLEDLSQEDCTIVNEHDGISEMINVMEDSIFYTITINK